MKKTIKILALIFVVASSIIVLSCKSEVQKKIEQYDLNKSKLEYLEALMKTREDLTYKENLKLIDSLIKEEKKEINVNNN